MQLLIITMIAAVLLFQYVVSWGILPRTANYAPELLAMAAAGLVIVIGVKNRFQYVRPAYWLVFGALVVVVACGAAVNLLESGPLFAGLRTYLRPIPFFFIPAVFALPERQLRTQVMLILAICVVQFPIAWEQRAAEIYLTGDTTFGTLMDSGVLSMFMICAACVLTGFYLRRKIRFWPYFILLIITLAPTMINETKIMLVMLPIALMTTFYAGSARGTRLKNTVLGLIMLSAFLSVFVPVYDAYMRPRWGYGILDFLTMEGRVEGYLVGGASIGDDATKARRFDGTVAALTELSKDPAQLIFGFGIGNASDSALGSNFVGEYYDLFSTFPSTSITVFILEYGLLGLGLILLLHWLIFRDSMALARQTQHGTAAIVAVGWAGVSAVMVLGLFYIDLVPSPALSYLYWYFSGVIVAARMRAALDPAVSYQATDRVSKHEPALTA